MLTAEQRSTVAVAAAAAARSMVLQLVLAWPVKMQC